MLQQLIDLYPSLGKLPTVTLLFSAILGCNVLLYLLSHSKEFLVICGVAFIYASVPMIHYIH